VAAALETTLLVLCLRFLSDNQSYAAMGLYELHVKSGWQIEWWHCVLSQY